jgi:hypothetical protein
MSRSVIGLNPRRLAIKERPARSSATACRVCSRFLPSPVPDHSSSPPALIMREATKECMKPAMGDLGCMSARAWAAS